MSQPSGQRPLRIVLFGLPRAGKTALLAALSQSQESQAALLPGPLEDSSGNLTRQRQLFYDELPRPTKEETVRYPVRIQTASSLLEAEFIDCDGRNVLELLKTRPAMEEAAGVLPQAILEADALILVADSSIKADLAERVLSAFDEFLHAHELERGRRSDVVGLPVFVVLTKCDLLAEDQDGMSDWMGRIEEQKRGARRRLHDLLDECHSNRPTYFGRLAVHLWATATRRPALRNAEARPRDPYGVAELFRQCLTAAQEFRRRQEKADHRLSLAVRTIAGLMGVMALMSAFLFSGIGQKKLSDLELRIDLYRQSHGATVETRLDDWPAGLHARRKELKDILNDAEFPALSEELRAEVVSWDDELKEYIPYLEMVLKTQGLATVRTDRQLDEAERRLAEALQLPAGKKGEEGKKGPWEDSGANKIRLQRLDDLRVLREQTAQAVAWYQDQYREGLDLVKFRRPERSDSRIDWDAWEKEVEKYTKEAALPPHETRRIPAHSLITPSMVLWFDRVRDARQAVLGPEAGWTGKPGILQELGAVRDVACALGLSEPRPGRPDLLELPAQMSVGDAFMRWRRLESHPELAASLSGLLASPGGMGPLRAAATFSPGNPLVPPYADFDRMFTWAHIPEAARDHVEKAASRSYHRALEALRQPIREKARFLMPDGKETLEGWQMLADWLTADPPELRTALPQRRLARALDRLRRPAGGDPVVALAAFLKQKPSPSTINSVTITLSDRLRASPQPSAKLVLKVGQRRWEFEPSRSDRQAVEERTVYSYSGPKGPLTFRPGEAVELRLDLRNDKVLTWSASRTATFAWEGLFLLPFLHRNDEAPTDGRRADGVVLKFDASPPLEAVPDLLPTLK